MMRSAIIGAALAASSALPVSAQISIDMSRITCAQYIALPAEENAIVSAWLSGWFNQRTGSVSVDLNAYARNVANVKTWCQSNSNATVMSGLEAGVKLAK